MDQQEPVLWRLYPQTAAISPTRTWRHRHAERDELTILDPLKGQIPDEVFTKPYDPPKTDGTGNIRDNLRAALKLLAAAGWSVKNGGSSTRRASPSTSSSCCRSGRVRARRAAVRPESEARRHQDERAHRRSRAIREPHARFRFRHDGGRHGANRSRPATSSATIGARAAADEPGSQNYAGIKSKAVDALVDRVIHAEDRDGLVAATHALDRVLLHGYYVIPNWHLTYFRVATWDKFGAPPTPPPYTLALDTWWVDPQRATRTSRRRSSRSEEVRERLSSRTACAMLAYALRRVLLIIPTLFAIILVNFVIVQAAPGGPVDQLIAELKGTAGGTLARVSGGGGELTSTATSASQNRARARPRPRIHQADRKALRLRQAAGERFLLMIRQLSAPSISARASSSDRPVIAARSRDKLPVSISLGLWTTLLIYLISIPLGIRKAVRDGSAFDVWTSGVIIVGYAIPGFLFAILLIVLFAGGSYLSWFPLRGLVSDNWASLDWPHRILDYFWHITLPVLSLVIGGFASLTMLTKNCFLDEINKQYVVTARAKGLTERRVLYGHVFRNAMLLVIAGFPGAFIGILFTGALLIEVIFSLDGLGLARLRGGDRPRLSDHVRHALHLHADRAWR